MPKDATKSNGLMLKVGLLSVSVLMGTQMAITPAIPGMLEFYTEQTRAQVESLSTVQSITGLIFVLLCPAIARKLGKKRTMMVGLIIAAVTGMVPVFVTSYTIVWASRLLFGVGVGLVCALAISMIGDFFEGDERASLLGIRTSMETVGQVAGTAAAGVLIAGGWNRSFWVYAVVFVLLALFAIGVPADEPVDDEPAAERPRQSVNLATVVLTLLNFLTIICWSSFNVRIPSIVVEGGFGTAGDSSLVISALAICGMLVGFVFGKIFELLRGKTAALGAALFAAAYLVAWKAGSLPMMYVSALLGGAAYPIIISFVTNRVAEIAPEGSAALCTSVVISGGFMAGFVCPTVLAWVGQLVGSEAAAAPFLPFGIEMLVIAAVMLILFGRE